MSNEVNGIDMNKKVIQEMRPKLRFSAFKDSLEWQEKKISEILTESRILGSKGDTAKKITVKLWGKGVFEKEEANAGSTNTQYYKRKSGQFIYSKLDFLNQAFGIIPNKLDGFESTVDLPCFDWKEGTNPIYFLEYVKREGFYIKFGEIADGGRKAKRIQVETFLSFPILLPRQIAEQQKIADCLASIDDLIDAESSKLDALKKHKKGLLQVLFPQEGETAPRVRFPEFRGAPKWEYRLLGELLLSPPDYGINAPAVPFSEKLPTYLRITDISTDGFFRVTKRASVAAKVSNNYFLNKGDIVLARTGASVGKSYKYRTEDGQLVFAGFLIRIKPNPCEVNDNYLFSFFSTNQYWQWVSITSARSGQPGINGDEYATLPIPIPPLTRDGADLSEQRRIADCFSSIDSLILAQAQKISLLKTCHKKGLMQQLFPNIDEANR